MGSKAKMKKVSKMFTPKRAVIAKVGSEPLELPNHNRGKAPVILLLFDKNIDKAAILPCA